MNIIIIPAYNPPDKMIDLIDDLLELSLKPIVVINDGSDSKYLPNFNSARSKGCHVLHLEQNKGKGASIKTGIEYASQTFPQLTGYITCDADGQHLATDIEKIDKELNNQPTALVLGTRDFISKNVPFKSRLGNRFSALYFKLSTGLSIKDTQTGLRGIPVSLTKEALDITEDRYDYEMNFLMHIADQKYSIVEVPIETVYLDENNESHFRPIVDSIRIYKKPLKFSITSLSSALIDLGIFTILTMTLSDTIAIVVLISTVLARIASGLYNFFLNRIWAFRSFSSITPQFKKYFLLYITQLLFSALFVTIISYSGLHLTVIKLVVDGLLFIGSYFIQRKWVFKITT